MRQIIYLTSIFKVFYTSHTTIRKSVRAYFTDRDPGISSRSKPFNIILYLEKATGGKRTVGRTATISQADVARARTELRAAGLPHGITAIRRRIGRGSPQLIAQMKDLITVRNREYEESEST